MGMSSNARQFQPVENSMKATNVRMVALITSAINNHTACRVKLYKPTTKLADTKLAEIERTNTKLADVKLADRELASTKLPNTKLADNEIADTTVANTELADTELADEMKADTTNRAVVARRSDLLS